MSKWRVSLSVLIFLFFLVCLALTGSYLYMNTTRDEHYSEPTPNTVTSTPTITNVPELDFSINTTISPTKVISPPDDIMLPLILNRFTATACDLNNRADDEEKVRLATHASNVVINGELREWFPLTLSFVGPLAAETDDDPNPFLDYRLQVIFIGPRGQVYNVPGFFAGNGSGNGTGNIWQVRFAPDEKGPWRYCTSFRQGTEIAVAADPFAGVAISFDRTEGTFEVGELEPDAPGFLKWGRLEYVDMHYLKFRDGPYWIKGGTNSPENFLGYKGFDNTLDQGGIIQNFLHEYPFHMADWQPDDPEFTSEDGIDNGKGIIGALNYLSSRHVNSVYFLPMNLGGDGQETYPFVGASGSRFDNTHFDISKLHQWNIVFEHAQRRGIALQVVLNETETENRDWLDNGRLGVERMLFYRELIARFGYILALKWNLSEESVFSYQEINLFADYIQSLDWADHIIAIHNPAGVARVYEGLLNDLRFVSTSFQYEAELAGEYVELWRDASANNGHPWIIDMDENNPAGVGLSPWNAGELRKQILYDVYFSGGNIEWYSGYYEPPIGGDINLEDFRTREAMWDYMWFARRFMEENLPFWEMEPADELLTGAAEDFGGGQVFAKVGHLYAIYLPRANPSGTLFTSAPNLAHSIRWYDPRTGLFEENSEIATPVNGNLVLGDPPFNLDGDWVVLVTVRNPTLREPRPEPYP